MSVILVCSIIGSSKGWSFLVLRVGALFLRRVWVHGGGGLRWGARYFLASTSANRSAASTLRVSASGNELAIISHVGMSWGKGIHPYLDG